MKRFWKCLFAACAAAAVICWLVHRDGADHAAEACRIYEDMR